MKLNDCPLCNSIYADTFYMDGKYFCSCEDCGIRTQNYDTEEEAQQAWNNLPTKNPKSSELVIQFHKIHPDVILPESHNGVCYDISIPERTFVFGNEINMINLGFSCKLPEGYHAELYVRSSTPKKYNLILANSVGIIDSSYCGDNDEWIACCYLMDGSTHWIEAGTRLFQFKLVKNLPTVSFRVVDTLNGIDRGGFGSTGV